MALVEIGAGWTKESKKGNPYISVSIDMDKLNKTLKMDQTKVNAVMMENKYKEKDTQPDYKISVRTDEE
jgi:uncharacterized protein (DUF736 family)